MRTILVDDELWALEQFKIECADIKEVEDVVYFQSPVEALAYASEQVVDFALLDIEMAEMNGIVLAKKLQEINPQIIIIFVSAYEKYVIESVRMKADYYLLKPYEKEDIIYVMEKAKLLAAKNLPALSVRTFGQFDVFLDKEALSFGGSKTKEIFAMLIDKRGGQLTTEEGFYRLYEGKVYNNQSAAAYRKVIKRLKTFLQAHGLEDVLRSEKGHYSLDISKIDCDYYHFLDGDKKTIQLFADEYMSDYWWAEDTLANLVKIKNTVMQTTESFE